MAESRKESIKADNRNADIADDRYHQCPFLAWTPRDHRALDSISHSGIPSVQGYHPALHECVVIGRPWQRCSFFTLQDERLRLSSLMTTQVLGTETRVESFFIMPTRPFMEAH